MKGYSNREGTMCVLRLSRLIVLGIALWSATAEATTYYVAPTGNDANTGTSISTPFRTIGKAASVAQPDDVVNVRGGTYNEAVTLPRGGTPGNPITYQRYQSEAPILDGTGISTCAGSSAYGVLIRVPNIVWDGISIRNFDGTVGCSIGGVRLVDMGDSTSYTIIRNSTISNVDALGNPSCIYVQDYYAGTLEIANNVLHDCGGAESANPANRAGITIFSDGLQSGMTSFVWVHHNEVYNEGVGIKYKHQSLAGVGTATFEYNLVHDIPGPGCLQSEQPGTIIRNNICYNQTDTDISGMRLSNTGGGGACPNCQAYNNSFYNVRSGFYVGTGTTGVTIRDNIICTTGYGWGVVTDSGSTISVLDYNDYCGLAVTNVLSLQFTTSYILIGARGLGYEAHGFTGDPLYVNPTGNPPDFHLKAGSPAKGAGTGGFDMGAYRTGTEVIGPTSTGGGSPTPPSSPSNLRVS